MTNTAELIHRSGQAVQDSAADPIISSRALVGRRNLIVDAMKTAMKEGIHFGKIPGTQKPTLYKPGAEMLCSMFRIGIKPVMVEDLSIRAFDQSIAEVRYRVTVEATSQVTGEHLGSAVGECSSHEEKYRWRKPVCDEEFDDTPVDQRREVWKKNYNGKPEKIKQVRMSPADLANTILQMGTKRGFVACTRLVTAASDVFGQDLEDLPREVVESIGDGEQQPEPGQEPRRKSERAAEPSQSNHDDHPGPDDETPNGKVFVKKARWIKDGTSAKGPWSMYAVELSDGQEYLTFDEGHYKTAVHAKDNGIPVVHDWRPNGKNRDKRDLASLDLLEG